MRPQSFEAAHPMSKLGVDETATEYFAFSTFAAASDRAKELARCCGVSLWVRQRDDKWSVLVEASDWPRFAEAISRRTRDDDELRARRADRAALSYNEDPLKATDGRADRWPGFV